MVIPTELDPGAVNAAGTAQGTTGENQDAQNDDTKLTLSTFSERSVCLYQKVV